jgi:hypothetical protein
VLRLVLALAIVQMHLGVCPHGVAAGGRETKAAPKCCCCGHEAPPEAPADLPDDRDQSHAPCPCLACSPGYVPLLAQAPTATADVATEDLQPPMGAARPDRVYHSRLDRPPR